MSGDKEMDNYEETAVTAEAPHDIQREVTEMFHKIVAGCATMEDRQRYLAIWERAGEMAPAQGAH
jgi:hypothetical protein